MKPKLAKICYYADTGTKKWNGKDDIRPNCPAVKKNHDAVLNCVAEWIKEFIPWVL